MVFASPSTGLNGWFPPPFTIALVIFPLSSLNLISNEFSSPPYTQTSLVALSEYGISTVGATAGAAGVAGVAGAVGVVGAELGALTVTLTGTSSLDPSGYVTTTVASFSPGVVVSTGLLKATFVPLGRSLTFPIESSAFGVVPLFTVCGLAVGVFLSASVGFLVTNSDKGFLFYFSLVF